MRRRIAAIVTVIGLMLGVSGALTPSSATTLCPPGCVLAGTVLAGGGFPSPYYMNISGEITTIATTRTGETVPNTAATGTVYYLAIQGDIRMRTTATPLSDVDNEVSGEVQFSAQRYQSCDTCSSPDAFSGTATVSGTENLLRLSSPKLEATLAMTGFRQNQGTYRGTVHYYG